VEVKALHWPELGKALEKGGPEALSRNTMPAAGLALQVSVAKGEMQTHPALRLGQQRYATTPECPADGYCDLCRATRGRARCFF
jgi:hypothetical protein